MSIGTKRKPPYTIQSYEESTYYHETPKMSNARWVRVGIASRLITKSPRFFLRHKPPTPLTKLTVSPVMQLLLPSSSPRILTVQPVTKPGLEIFEQNLQLSIARSWHANKVPWFKLLHCISLEFVSECVLSRCKDDDQKSLFSQLCPSSTIELPPCESPRAV